MKITQILLSGLVVICLTCPLWSQETWTVVYPAENYAASSQPKWPAGCPASNQQQFIDDPTTGYLTISTWIDPSEYVATRDTTVSYLTGITIECDVQVYSSCSTRGFQVQWIDAGGDIGMYLSPDKVEAGDGLYSSVPASTTFNTTTSFHTYRITRNPSTNNIRVYIDNQTTTPFTGSSATHTAGGGIVTRPSIPIYSSDTLTDRLLFGDNGVSNCNVVIETVRYHPGAQAPGGTNDLGSDTTPPPTPNSWANLTTWANGTETWDGEYNGIGTPTSEGWTEAGGGQEYNSYFGTSDTGYFTMDGDCNAYRSITTGSPAWQQDTTGLTIEARVQVAANSPDRAFNILYFTYQGSVGLYLSPSKVEIGDGSDPCGINILGPYYTTTTDTFHTYRITVPPHYTVNDNTYANLYIDNVSTAVFSNSEGDFEEVVPSIYFGNWDIFPLVPPVYTDVCLNYIRWHRGVTVPGAYNGGVPVELSNFNSVAQETKSNPMDKVFVSRPKEF
jgi:hypothetical protein